MTATLAMNGTARRVALVCSLTGALAAMHPARAHATPGIAPGPNALPAPTPDARTTTPGAPTTPAPGPILPVPAATDDASGAPPPRPHVSLNVAIDPTARRLTGTARIRLPNVSTKDLTSVPLWLYPNRLAERPAVLGDVNFHWLYPSGFSPAAMDVSGVRVGGTPVKAELEPTDFGARTVAKVTLPTAVPPGSVADLEVDFAVTLPERLGNFGCESGSCRLMGGFYPLPLHLGPGGFVAEAAPDRIDFSAQVAAPPGTTVLIDGALASPGTNPGAPVIGGGTDAPYATLVVDSRPFRFDDARASGMTIRFVHHHRRPPSSEDEVLPYVREDQPGLVLGVAREALDFLAEQGFDAALAGGSRPITLIEAPLRHELVHVHGDVVLVSDHLFEIFPLRRLRKFHRLELARAIFTAVMDRALRAIEPDPDVGMSADFLAAYLTEVFTLREFRKIEFARDLLRPLSFIPAVDQLMYAPLVASSSSYFGDLEDRDVVRDDIRRFSNHTPGGRFVFAKLLDLLGPEGLSRVVRTILGERVPLRLAAARSFGSSMDWFWRQWLSGPVPHVNYSLKAVLTSPLSPVGMHVDIDVAREGADLLEPVEVRVMDRAGAAHDLTWTERGTSHRFSLDLPAGLASVEIDPRHRLVESAVGSLEKFDDPLTDNRRPQRWRLIYGGFGALLDVTSLRASLAAAVTLKQQHDLRNEFVFFARHSRSLQAGLEAIYGRLFGPQADSNRLASEIGGGLLVGRLDPAYAVAAGEERQPGWRFGASVFFTHDDRDYYIDPWKALGGSAGIAYNLTLLDGGAKLSQLTGDFSLQRLLELAPGHVLAGELRGAATIGDIRLRSQLLALGGSLALRGYGVDELFGRGRGLARIELRDRYVSDLDWNLAHFTSVRGFGGNLFVEGGLVTSCDDFSVGSESFFADVGYSFRVLHDAFGVYQQMLSIDVAVPLTRRNRECLGQYSLGAPGDPTMSIKRPPFVVLISFLPAF